ncbi:hypothetical protein FHS83_002762 [Rhizomicrobium palustre]|uniref:Uncharacterized protein n=1 Tax=Rhizomicrobium palustre TaxID=189966 RepID=A0A846N0H1_9PROT|nr:hypothetical protein [Rhizomicrobium palustre]NIK89444.1 hypothetical protein [Rhizomicrobium palustre]
MRKVKLFCVTVLLAGACYAAPADEDKQIKALMLRQDILAVNNIAKPEDFVPDKDPNTLQVVFISDPNAKSSVSEDGEVVFMNPDLPVNVQNALTYEAFRRKLKQLQATGQATEK